MKYSRRDAVLMTLLLTLILVMAAGVRFYNIDSQSLWSDEGNSAALATRSFAQITRDTAHDIHPPLYYWLLKLWSEAFGTSEAGLRSLSALLGVLLVFSVAELARRIYGESTGLAAAFIASLAPFQVYYSQEARMYMLLALLATVAVLLQWHYIGHEARRLSEGRARIAGWRVLAQPAGLALTATWAAGLYTHYAFPIVIASMSLVYAAWLWYSRRQGDVGRRLLHWSLFLGLSLILYLPWLPVAVRQLLSWPGVSDPAGAGAALRSAIAVLTVGPAGKGPMVQWWMWVLLAVALLGTVPWRHIMSLPSGRPLTVASGSPCLPYCLAWLIPVAWVVAPLAMMLGLGLFQDAYLKFLLIASPAFSLLLARGIVEPGVVLSVPRRDPGGPSPNRPSSTFTPRDMLAGMWVTGVLALVGALSGAALVEYYTDGSVARDDYRAIAQFVTATAQANDAILLDAPGQAEVFGYYYNGNVPVFPLPRQRPVDVEDTRAELEKLLAYDKVYAVYWATEEADPDGIIENWMDSRGYKTLDQWRGNVRLAVYVMPERRTPDEAVEDLNATFGNQIVLLGYRGWNLTPAAGDVTQLQMIWRATATPERRYKVFLQLLDERDQVIAQRDAEPAGDARPTDSWQPGETILDNHGLLIRPGTPPGTYRRIAGMYDPETGERLTLPDGKDHINLPPVTVLRTATPPTLAVLDMQYSQSFDFGGITLLGHDRYKRGYAHAPKTSLYAGDRLHLTYYWRANIAPRADWWFHLALNDNDGHTVASLQAPLVSDTYATTLWQEGEIVRGEHDLSIPAELAPGTYRLSLTLLPDTDTPAGVAYLGTIRVSPP